jgi:methionyl-tRNA formyltransferase
MARLVFLGTPEAAVPPLRSLVGDGHDVALVVTRPDKRRGRGSGLLPSPVKVAAAELGLPVSDSLEDVTAKGADLGVVVAYGRVIPRSVLEVLPMVNLHLSLLPRWRGAAPVERAILEGDAETGVCLMAVEAGLDTGGLYAQVSTVIDDEESADDLRARLVAFGCGLLTTYLADGIAGLPQPRDQAGTPSYAEKMRPDEFELDWEQPALQLRRVIRLGRAWTMFRGRRLRILRATAGTPGVEGTDRLEPGTLRETEAAAGDGHRLHLVTVQPEGKRPMAASDWWHGVQPAPGERLGT